MTIPIQSIIHFSQVDQRLRDLHKELLLKENQAQKVIAAVHLLQEDVASARTGLSNKKKEIHSLELSIKSFQEDIKKKRKRLETITISREASALEQEVALLEEKINGHEDQILALLEQVDADEHSLRLSEESAGKILREYERKKEVLESEINTIQAESLQVEKERQYLFDRLPVDVKNQYERMKTRVENPFVPAIGDSCGGCFMKLTSQDLAKLRQSMVVLCKECYRLVYPQ
jgi:uncharacterized protein